MNRLTFNILLEQLYTNKEGLFDTSNQQLILANSTLISIVDPFKIYKVMHSDKYLTISNYGIYNLRDLLEMIKCLRDKGFNYNDIGRLLQKRPKSIEIMTRIKIEKPIKFRATLKDVLRDYIKNKYATVERFAKVASMKVETIENVLDGGIVSNYVIGKLVTSTPYSRADLEKYYRYQQREV